MFPRIFSAISQIFYWDIWSLMLLTGIFVLIIIDAKKNAFVKGVFSTAYAFLALQALVMIVLRLNILHYGKGFEFVNMFLGVGYLLIFYGVTLLIEPRAPAAEPRAAVPAWRGGERSLGLSALLFFVTFGIYFYFWLYRTVKDLRDHFESAIPYTPGKAVGFLFIPFFNIGWAIYLIYSLPAAMKRIERRYFPQNKGLSFHPVIISTSWVFATFISALPMPLPDELLPFIGKALACELMIIFVYLTIQAEWNIFVREAKSSEAGAGGNQAVSRPA
jgi:hypothetical protein